MVWWPQHINGAKAREGPQTHRAAATFVGRRQWGGPSFLLFTWFLHSCATAQLRNNVFHVKTSLHSTARFLDAVDFTSIYQITFIQAMKGTNKRRHGATLRCDTLVD